MDQDILYNKINVLSQMSADTILRHGDRYQDFHSNRTQNRYQVNHTDATIIGPILKVNKTLIKQSVIIINEEHNNSEYLLNHIKYNMQNQPPHHVDSTLTIGIVQVYTDKVEQVHNWLMSTNEYVDLTKEHKGIKEIFTDNIYKGITEYPNVDTADFTELNLYKNKETNELVFVSNYALGKKMKNKYGLLSVGSRPNDCNFLILLGLMPAFIPEFKDRITEDEKAFFKLLTTPVKVFHERASATLYEQIITTAPYNNLIKGYKAERLRQQFRQQEERLFNQNVIQATRKVEELVRALQDAEFILLNAEKDLTYYQAGDSKLEDAVSYILEHSYILDVDYSGNTLTCMFRVPLSQWDTEIASTILKGIKANSERYNLNSSFLNEIKQFIQYILIDQVAKYWVYAEFSINLDKFDWQNKKVYWNSSEGNFRPEKLSTYKAGLNPHMEYYNCTGSYSSYIEKARQKKDLPGMIECILAPFKNWNLTDGAVQSKMFSYAIPNLVEYNIPCIEYKGQMISIKELHARIEEEKKPKEESKPAPKKRASKPKVLHTVPDPEQIVAQDITIDQTRTFDINVDDTTAAAEEEELRAQAERQGGEANEE